MNLKEEYMNCKTLWLDNEQLIASFHAIRGYEPKPVLDRAELLRLIDSLMSRGYKFM